MLFLYCDKWTICSYVLFVTMELQKIKIMASGPITSWQIDGKKVETVADFIFLGSKITETVIWELQKIKSDTVSTVSPSISHQVMGPDAMIFVF